MYQLDYKKISFFVNDVSTWFFLSITVKIITCTCKLLPYTVLYYLLMSALKVMNVYAYILVYINLLLFLHIIFYIYELRVVKKLYFESQWICKMIFSYIVILYVVYIGHLSILLLY